MFQKRDENPQRRNSGNQCVPGFLDDESDVESVLLLEQGDYHCGGCRSAEGTARFKLTEPVREIVGESALEGVLAARLSQ